jgi:hypothetical protein
LDACPNGALPPFGEKRSEEAFSGTERKRRRCFCKTAIGDFAMPTRTTHRSRSGTKLYAKRNKKGQFEDIQIYKRAHGQDVRRSSKKERASKGA